jgi:N utilization substance protein A
MPKNEFIVAITQLAAEKNLPKEVVFDAVEAALASAYKKDALAESNVVVKIDPETGATRVFTRQTVVEEVENPEAELTLEEARKQRPGIQLGEHIDHEIAAQHSGRIAAQTAKQVVLQRLREAEREVVFEEYSGRESDIVSGEMVRMEGRNVIIDLGKAEALLPPAEQVRNEHYRSGQRMKFYVLEVYKAAKGPQVVVSRTHKNLIRRLFELEVPEIFKGIVEIKAIAREPGYRSKVAVWSTQEGVDPVGACVGLRGVRIQNIVNELNGERIDVVLWDPEESRFVAHALSPAQVTNVKMHPDTNTAETVVPDRQLSLAIGKEGQNARLAAKLTGWRIDIKSQSVYDEILANMPPEELEAQAAAEAAAAAEAEAAVAAEREAAAAAAEPVTAVAEETVTVEEAPPETATEEAAKPQIRFAEEILGAERGKKAKAKKEGLDDEEAKPKKAKRPKRIAMEEEDDEFVYDIH